MSALALNSGFFAVGLLLGSVIGLLLALIAKKSDDAARRIVREELAAELGDGSGVSILDITRLREAELCEERDDVTFVVGGNPITAKAKFRASCRPNQEGPRSRRIASCAEGQAASLPGTGDSGDEFVKCSCEGVIEFVEFDFIDADGGHGSPSVGDAGAGTPVVVKPTVGVAPGVVSPSTPGASLGGVA